MSQYTCVRAADAAALIVFDIDGTLLETQRVTVPAVQRVLAAYGIPVPDAEVICQFFGKPVESYLDWLGALAPETQRGEIVDAVNRLELELIGKEGCLYPGVGELLEKLVGEGHQVALCSNGPDDYVAMFVEAYGLKPLCSIVRARGTRYTGKTAMLAEILSLIPARPALMIGDRRDDVEAAHNNGMYAVAAGYGFGSEDELKEADRHAAAPEDLLPAIRSILHAPGP